MANVYCIIVNPTATAYTDVNAAGADIPAYSMGTDGLGTVTILTDAEMATFNAAHTTALVQITTVGGAATSELRRKAAKILKLGKFPSEATA